MRTRADKILSMAEAAALVSDGDCLGLGGNVLHRSPAAFARELCRQGRRSLHLVKTAGAYDVDILCAAGAVASVSAGYVAYETDFGFATHYRLAVEKGIVEAREHACYTVITALRASVQGVSFLPVRGLEAGSSDLPAARGWKLVRSPYGEESYVAIPAISPDWTIIHVQEADASGNARVFGPAYEDMLLAQAARRVIVTAERLVERLSGNGESTLPGFLVKAVVCAPGGARPGSCAGRYDIDHPAMSKFKTLAPLVSIAEHLAAYERSDRGGSSHGA